MLMYNQSSHVFNTLCGSMNLNYAHWWKFPIESTEPWHVFTLTFSLTISYICQNIFEKVDQQIVCLIKVCWQTPYWLHNGNIQIKVDWNIGSLTKYLPATIQTTTIFARNVLEYPKTWNILNSLTQSSVQL